MAPQPGRKREVAAKLCVLVAAFLGLCSTMIVILVVPFSGPALKVLIAAIGLVLVVASALGWKLISLSFAHQPHVMPNPSLIRAYNFNAFAPPHPVRIQTVLHVEPQFAIPRAQTRGRLEVPQELAPPPPPPTYDMSEAVVNTAAPPPYSENGVLRRAATDSPPPEYDQQTAINSPPPTRNNSSTRTIVIDCSKAEPAMFSIQSAESVI